MILLTLLCGGACVVAGYFLGRSGLKRQKRITRKLTARYISLSGELDRTIRLSDSWHRIAGERRMTINLQREEKQRMLDRASAQAKEIADLRARLAKFDRKNRASLSGECGFDSLRPNKL